MRREIARMLANDYKKRVMIVDTSNEIGGDGDIPHEGIGNARRMQVPNSDKQHKVRGGSSMYKTTCFDLNFLAASRKKPPYP